jgi:hypothetical protein
VSAASDDSGGATLVTGPGWEKFARQVQDVLFQMRRLQPRTPVWFFRRFHDQDRRDFEYRMRLIEERISSPVLD